VKMNIRVSRKKPESLTSQIREQLFGMIDSGALVAGSLLPSERELANL
jgi:DNA-binding GntR family transcriptional regulator